MRECDPVRRGPHSRKHQELTKAVLFDRDGVLTFFDIDSAIAFFRPLLPIPLNEIAARWQALGAAIGFPRSLAEEKQFFHDFWNELSEEFNLSAEQRSRLTGLDYTIFLLPYPEVRSVLNELHARNIRLGVLSNFSLASLEQSLVTTRLAEYFNIMCTAAVIGVAKPSARAYEIALNALQVRPEQCLFFDDEVICTNGARRVGMRAYLVNRQARIHDFDAGVVADLTPVPMLVSNSGS